MDASCSVAPLTPAAEKSAGAAPDGPPPALAERSPGARRGFTLIEMLTVVVIIGILASFITAAVIAARRKARIAVIGLEINQLEMALKAYKEKHGEYPPDFAGLNGTQVEKERAQRAVLRHLTIAFPRFSIPGAKDNDKWLNLHARLAKYGVDVDKLDPSTALPFWLGGLPDGPGSTKLIGFSANVMNPFDIGIDKNGNGVHDPGEELGSRLEPLFEFDPTRLKIEDGVLRYYPDVGSGGQNAPYVYFRAGNGIYGFRVRAQDGTYTYVPHPGFVPPAAHPEWGATGPCLDTRVPAPGNTPPYEWASRDTFQIRAAGLDGIFGIGVRFPTGDDYDDATFDDQTNFNQGTLEDKM